MSVIRVGSTSKYAEGWDTIFGGGTPSPGKTGGRRKKAALTPTKRKTNKGLGGGRKPSTKQKRVKSRRRK